MKKTFTKFLAALALLAFFIPSFIAVGQTTTTYTFTAKNWTATSGGQAANWTSGKDGAGFSNNGIQVTTNATGANGTSPVSFTNVTKIVCTYNTNKSKGAGSIVAQIGSNTATTNNVAYTSGDGTTANYTTTFNYSTPQSGNVKLTVNTTTNSIYLVSVAITTGGTSPCDNPTFSVAAGAYASTQNVTITCATSEATIYYTTDGTDPTTNSNVYSSAISVSSTTTIKAMAVKSGYDNSSIASATYAIVGHAGTQADPYTVADALEVIDAGVGMTNVYATGTVSGIVDAWSTQYHNISFNISDDGETSSDQLEAFRCVSGTGVDASEVTAGDEVVVYGTLTLYNSTYEFTSGCTLVSLTHSSSTVLDPVFTPTAGGYSGTKAVEITCATEGATIYYTTDGNDPTTSSNVYSSAITVSSNTTIKAVAYLNNNHSEVVTATYKLLTDSGTTVNTVTEALAYGSYPQNGVFVSGIVCTAPSSLISGGMLTYYISADGTETDRLQVYKGMNMDNTAFTAVDDIQVGDIVTIYGNVKVYNSTTEFDQGNYLVSLQRPVVPVINADDVNIEYSVTSGSIEYTITNGIGNVTAAVTTGDWITLGTITSSAVPFTCSANEGTTDRTATITLSYTGAADKTVTVTQGHYTVDYAELPFEYEGGVLSDFTSMTGTSYSLSNTSSYAESNAPYRIKFTATGDYLQVKTDSQPGIITIGVKMLGGATTSHIYVKGSADGETFDEGESLEISGSNNAVVNLTSTRTFNANVRYVRFYFDKGANVGVGPITIAQVTNDPFITVADATVNDVPAAGGNGTLAITYGYLDISDMSDFGVQFYDAEGEEESEPDWVEVLVAEEQTGEYVVSYVVDANSGAARTAYCKVFALGDTDYVYSNLITISQVEYVDTEDYELYSGALVEGDYVIYYNGYAMKNEVISNRLSYKTVTPNSNVIAADASIVWHIAPSATEGYWTIYSADAEAYAASTGANNKAQMLAELNNDNNNMALWSVTVAESKDNTYEFVNKYNYDNNANSTLRNNGTYGFACYANTTGGTLSLYKKVETPTTFEYEITGYTNEQATNGWYLIASPVMDDITPAADNGFIISDYDLYRFNPTATNLEWENHKVHDFDIEHGRGYLYASKTTTTLQFTGTPHTDSEVTLAYTGWNLIGNPSNIEVTISESFYVMNDDHNDLVAAASGRTVHGMEGIFVYGNQGDEIAFEEQPAKRANSQVTLNIVGNNGNVIDRAIVNFDSNNTMTKLMLDESNTKIYIPMSDANYAVVSSNGKGNMPVNFKAARTGKYTLRVETEGVDMNYMHIIDRLTGEDINVLLDNEYTFIAAQNDVEGRFILSFNENGYNAEADETFAFQNGSDVIVNGNGELQVFDVTGRMVNNTVINGVEAIAMPQGVYIFRLNEKVQKIVVR